MKNKKIPDNYFENEEFLVESIDEDLVIGVLGKNPSADQLLKFELCTYIRSLIEARGLSLSIVEEITGINSSDVSRIKNHHLDRFTIDKLIKIYASLDSQNGVARVLRSAGDKIQKIS